MISFDKGTHEYTLDGRKLISVTQLMRKHGLSPDYSAADPEVLRKKAERGTIIHKEIEDYIKNGEIGFTAELASFIDWRKASGISRLESEVIVHNDIVAGTCDLLFESDGVHYIADIKTTSTLHKDSVSWQLSIYNCLMGWAADEGQAFHFGKDGSLKVVGIPLKPREEVEKLLEAERNGEKYLPDIIIDRGQLILAEAAQRVIEEAERAIKEAKAKLESVNKAIIEEMEKAGIKTFENESLKITYVSASERTAIDAAKLKAEHPDIAAECSKTTKTAASVRIRIKETE